MSFGLLLIRAPKEMGGLAWQQTLSDVVTQMYDPLGNTS